MDLFDERVLDKLDRECEKNKHFNESKQKLRIVSTSCPTSSLEYLLRLKQVFQKMLPKMPREYIIRQVFDPKHCCLVLVGPAKPDEDSVDSIQENIIGAVCYRPAFELNLIEIVFFAIASEFHVSGYGTFLFNCLKEVIKMQFAEYLKVGDNFKKRDIEIDNLEWFTQDEPVYMKEEYTSSKNLYFLTYADNSAVGFFKKQGFSLYPVSATWKGYIKDYDGGTLMECKVLRDIPYLNKKAIVKKVRDKIFEEMKKVNEYHIIRSPDEKECLRPFLKEYENQTAPRTLNDVLKDFIFFLLCALQSDPSSWPFLEPVSTVDVPDYITVIKEPMDLGTMSQRHRDGFYTSLKTFSKDLKLMINNCYTYNGKGTQYYKCAENMEQTYKILLENYSYFIKKWEFDPGEYFIVSPEL